MKKKIVVTGASGFIGRYCLPRLIKEEFEVHVIGRSIIPTMLATSGIIFHSVDLFDANAVRNILQKICPSHLLHCAWIATPGVFWASPDNIRWLTATIQLVQIFAEIGGQKILGIGSCAEYDWSKGGICTENTTPLLPHTVYGKCKLAAFEACSALASLHHFSFAWARLFFPYGIGEPSNKFISSVMNSLIKGEKVQCSHGRQMRDFLYIEDVADALVALLMSQGEGAFNVASGRAWSLKDIVREITLKTGGQSQVLFGSIPTQFGEPEILLADTERLFNQVSWRPKVDLPSGIKRMLEVLSTSSIGSEE